MTVGTAPVLDFGMIGDALDGAAQVVGTVDAAEAVAQVPVGGVEDAHGSSPGV